MLRPIIASTIGRRAALRGLLLGVCWTMFGFVVADIELRYRVFSETLTVTNLVVNADATITRTNTGQISFTTATNPQITTCDASPPTAVKPAGSLCLDTTNSRLYQTSGGGVWAQIGGTTGTPTVGQFGDGSDGDATISVNTTLARDMYYNNLTVNTGVVLNAAGFRVYVAGTMTLSGTGKISNDGGDGGAGTGASGGGAGAAGSGGSTATGQGGGAGSINGCCNNGQGSSPCFRGLGVAGAGGGNTGGIGGTGGTCVNAAASAGDIRSADTAVFAKNSAALSTGVGAGPGGGGGAGAAACGGGGGGGGGGYLFVAAKTWTGSGSLSTVGGRGGNGATGCGVGVGSSGGGGGSGGVLVFESQSLTSPTETFNGGAGGNGNGQDVNFSNGHPGSSGISLNFVGN